MCNFSVSLKYVYKVGVGIFLIFLSDPACQFYVIPWVEAIYKQAVFTPWIFKCSYGDKGVRTWASLKELY